MCARRKEMHLKAVKIWGYILVALIPVLYLIGIFTNTIDSWYDIAARGMDVDSALYVLGMGICLISAISMFVVSHALETLQHKHNDDGSST